MAFVYLAHAPADEGIASRLSSDLQKAGIETWHETASNGEIYQNLKQATHFVAILSPDALAHEHFLAALEYARENQLPRLALRLTQLESLPPQLTGILPLDFTNEENYADGLETLIEDLQLEPPPPPLQLPEDILKLLESEMAVERKVGVEALLKFKDKDHPLHALAFDELRAMSFGERDEALRKIAHAAVQAFQLEERLPPPEAKLPTKDELEQQAASQPAPVIVGEPGIKPKREYTYFWQTNRWNPVLMGLAVLVAGLVALITWEWAYLIPLLVTGLLLPQFNILIRENGARAWDWPKPLIGNSTVGVVLTGISALILSLLLDLGSLFLMMNLVLGLLYGVVVGWLSSLKT